MPRRTADDERVLAVAEAILKEHLTVLTQARMTRLIHERLQTEDPDLTVSPERARRLLASAPFCRLEFRTRLGSRAKPLYACPVCGGALDRLKNLTLFGGEVTLVQRCKRCTYRTGKEKQVPTFYVFHWRP